MSAEGKFTEEERLTIEDAIAIAEKNTSGEIRLFVESECGNNVMDRAAFIFRELKMHKTRTGTRSFFILRSTQDNSPFLATPVSMQKLNLIFGMI